MELTKIEQFEDAGIEVLESTNPGLALHTTIRYRDRTFLLRTRAEWAWDRWTEDPLRKLAGQSVVYATDAEEVTMGSQWKCPGIAFDGLEDAIVDTVNVIILAVDREEGANALAR